MQLRFTVFLSPLFILFICSCGSGGSENKSMTDSVQTDQTSVLSTTSSLCFQRISGNRRQDTATVYLMVNKDVIDGNFINSIYEKDIRSGELKGIIKDSIITATWSFMQEGRQDTLPVVFRLSGNKLLQKPYTIDPATGRELLIDGNKFSIEYESADCGEWGK